jgi:hypothetical protein
VGVIVLITSCAGGSPAANTASEPPLYSSDSSKQASTLFDEEDEWDVVPFEDPRDSSEYDIIDGRVIVAWSDWEPLPELDPNDFDSEMSVPANWEESEFYPNSRLAEEAIANFIEEEELVCYAEWPEVGAAAFVLPEGQSVADAVQNWHIEYFPLIASVDPDALAAPLAFPTDDPNDDEFPNQWYIDESHSYDINCQDMWRKTYGLGTSSGVVAILDTGVEEDNALPDLQQTDTALGCNTGDKRASTTFTSRSSGGGEAWTWVKQTTGLQGVVGHGTCIAGLISARPNNDGNNTEDGKEFAGVAYHPRYYPVAMKLYAGGNFSFSAILNALTAVGCTKRIYNPAVLYGGSHNCPQYNIEVVNMSFDAGKSSDTVLQRHIDQLSPYMLFVGAAGNGNVNGCVFPASYYKVLAVGGYDTSRQRATYYGTAVDVFAPGSNLKTSDMPGSYGGNFFGTNTEVVSANLTGSSTSAALVSGVAVVLSTAFPADSPAHIRTRITAGAVTISGGNLNGRLALDAEGAYDYTF